MSSPAAGFDVTPFLHQDEGQHFDRKSLFHGPPDAKKPRVRKEVRDQVARWVAGFANATQVNNASLRQLIGLDTLGASQVLRRLRDRSMLELHRAGSQSYYTLGPALLAGDRPDQGKLALDRGDLHADRGGLPADRGGLSPDRGGLEQDRGRLLDPELQQVLAALGTRPRKEKLRQAIGQLCAGQWRSVAWLAALLRFEPRNLSDRHLTPMLKDGLLERRLSDIPSHPDQAYRSIPSPVHAAAANPNQEDNA